MITGAATWRTCTPCSAVTSPGRRVHPAGALLLQSRDGGAHDRLPPGAGCDRRVVPARPRKASAARSREDARHRHRLAEQPDRRGVPGGGAARGERALPRPRPLSHQRRGLRVLHVTVRPACVAASFDGADAYTISLFSLSKRTASPAGVSGTWCIRAPARRDHEVAGHHPRCVRRHLAGGRDGRARGRRGVLSRAPARACRGPRHRPGGARVARALCTVRRPTARSTVSSASTAPWTPWRSSSG